MNGRSTAHMRTISEAAEYFKSIDSDTALSKTAIRRLVKSGEVYSVRIGNRALVSIEALNDYLNGGERYENKR